MKDKNLDVKEQIKSIALEQEIDEDKAAAIAQKCYDEVYWRPYGGATSFAEIDQVQATREYAYKVEDESYKLRSIIENITSTEDFETSDKVNAIKEAAQDYGDRIGSLSPDSSAMKSFVDAFKNLFNSSEKVIRKEGNKWVLYTKDGKRKLGTHDTRAGAVAQERAIEANKELSESFKVFKDKETGDYRWLSFSSNAFEDKEKELFSTKALEDAVEYADKKNEHGPLMFYHIPDTEIGQCDFQAVQGRFLIESGTFDNSDKGNKALANLLAGNEKYEVSIGYKFIDGDDNDGTYDWLRFRERSICPPGTAANPWTELQVIGDKEMDEKKKEALKGFFGEDLANSVISNAEEKTKDLEEQNVRYKTVDTEEKTEDKSEILKNLAKELGLDEEKVLAAAKKVASEEKVEDENKTEEKTEEKEDKKEDPDPKPSPVTIEPEKFTQLAQLVADMAESVETMQEEIKELKKSDDEKVAAISTPKGDTVNRPSQDATNRIAEEIKSVLSGGKEEEQDSNPASKYVQDLINANGRVPAN